MNLYQPQFLTSFNNKLLKYFFGILLMAFAFNIGIIMSVQADVGDTPADALEIEFGQEYSDDLSSFLFFVDDADFYKFELPDDGRVIILLRTEDEQLLQSFPWKLYGNNEDGTLGREIRDDLFSNYKIAQYQEGLSAGTYYIKIYCGLRESIACNTNPYYLTVYYTNDIGEKEPNNFPIESTEIELEQEYSGILFSHEDVDYYKFQLLYESDVTITLGHNNDNLSPLTDIYWNGTLEKSDNDDILRTLNSIGLKGTPSEISIQHKNLPYGTYWFKVRTDKGITSSTSSPYHFTINTTQVKYAGYAIIVQGRDKAGTLKDGYNKTIDNVQTRLTERGFLPEHIKSFKQDKVDPYDNLPDKPVKSDIQESIEDWAKDKLNNSPAPLYIIMVDHGYYDDENINFSLYPESISAEEINGWLDKLESNLTEEAKQEPRFFIVGTCFSGSFIDKVSKPGRIIITSASANEKSYTDFKPRDPNSIAEGELFIKILFEQLGYHSKTFMDAFEIATKETKNRTNDKKYPNGKQHPLFDDNGDGNGSMTLMYDGDGNKLSELKLGFDSQIDNKQSVRRLDMDINYMPIDIVAKTETLYLDENESSDTLWLKTNYDDSEQIYSGIFIKTPNPADVTEKQHGDGQIELSFPARDLIFNYDKSRFETEYDAFNEPGKYTIFYIASDSSGNTSQTYSSTVYKNKDGNNPPEAFSLLLPEDGATTRTTLRLDWEPSIDLDGDSVIYNLVIGSDEKLQNIVYQEELQHSSVIIDNNILKTLETYYWRVEAIDGFGARISSDVFSFYTEDTSEPIGGYTGNVVGILGEPIDVITITITPIDKPEFAISTDYYRENEEQLEFEHIFDDENDTIFEVFLINLGSDTKYNLKIKTFGFQEEIIKDQEGIIKNLDINEIIEFGRIELQPLTTFKSNLLDIPVVFVEGLGRYSAKLRKESEQIFGLEFLEFLEGVNKEIANETTYDDATKIVSIPSVRVDDTTLRYDIKLKLIEPYSDDWKGWKFDLINPNSLF